MPLYDYEDTRTGARVELFRYVADRDKVPAHLRRLMPDRLLVHGHGLKETDPINFVESARRGFSLAEDRLGRSGLAKEMGMSIPEIRRVWNDFNQTDQPKERAA